MYVYIYGRPPKLLTQKVPQHTWILGATPRPTPFVYKRKRSWATPGAYASAFWATPAPTPAKNRLARASARKCKKK